MAVHGRIQDPLFHFETHFPERLSHLHMNPDYPSARRQKKTRNRTGARYKTQPITFDEIQEVDEEPVEEQKGKDGLKNQFQAFSRSMDGLVLKNESKEGSPNRLAPRSVHRHIVASPIAEIPPNPAARPDDETTALSATASKDDSEVPEAGISSPEPGVAKELSIPVLPTRPTNRRRKGPRKKQANASKESGGEPDET